MPALLILPLLALLILPFREDPVSAANKVVGYCVVGPSGVPAAYRSIRFPQDKRVGR
jgi:hypothetical protein